MFRVYSRPVDTSLALFLGTASSIDTSSLVPTYLGTYIVGDIQEEQRLESCGIDETIMAPGAVEQAFKRHPRPQVPTKAEITQRLTVPTKAALLQRAREDDKRRALTYQETRESPWETLIRQGDLVQGKRVRTVCIDREQLVMVREMSNEAGRRQLDILKILSEHPHVSTVKQAFETNNSVFFQLEYSRYTLEEVLNVHNCLGEPHIRAIASAVY